MPTRFLSARTDAANVGPESGRTRSRRRDDAVARIQELIQEDGLGPGDRLPGERKLAKRFDISRGSVREGLQFLATLGLLEVRHGGGTFLRVAPDNLDRLWSRWGAWVSQNRDRILETFEVRMGAEAFAAELAARRARPEDLERLARAVQAMREAVDSNEVAMVIRCDLAFHDALLQAAGNKTLRTFLVTLGEELIPSRAAVVEMPGRAERSYAEHREIYEAVRTGNVRAASEGVRRHLESVQGDVLAYLVEHMTVEDDGQWKGAAPAAADSASGIVARLWTDHERD